MDKYTPEVLVALMGTVYNMTLVCACAWATVKLYERSGSWHCLWALLMLLAITNIRFIRD